MKIKSLKITNFKPIKNIELNDLGSIVIIAGANGAGKTRLKEAIVATLQGNPLMNMTIEATRKEEREPKYFLISKNHQLKLSYRTQIGVNW